MASRPTSAKKSPTRKKSTKNADQMALSDAEKAKKAALKIQVLQRELVDRSELAARAVAQKNELREQVHQAQEDFEKEKEDRFDVLSSMARQYKGTQEHLLKEIHTLNAQMEELRDEMTYTKHYYSELLAEKDRQLQEKDARVDQLQQQMDEMAERFHHMLNETLERIQQKIERASTSYMSQTMPAPRLVEKQM